MNSSPTLSPAPPAPLTEVLTYENDHLIYKFMENWDLPESEVRELFVELKKWMWVSALSIYTRSNGGEAPMMMIGQSMILLDEIWHHFILFSRDYQAFCQQYLGFYLHHSPTTREEKEKTRAELESDPEGFSQRMESQLEAQYSFIYDHLGEETLLKWYSSWTEKITPDFLDQIRKNYWRN